MPVWAGPGSTPKEQKQLQDFLKQHPEITGVHVDATKISPLPTVPDATPPTTPSITPPSTPGVSAPSGTVTPTDAEAITGASIPMTQAELDAMAQHNAQATCAGEMQKPNVYKVSGWDKDHNWVSVTVEAINKKQANSKAAATGLNVKQVTRQIAKPATTEVSTQVITEHERQDGSIKLDSGEWVSIESYDSLSKVAFAITGTHWNGPRFFGLRDRISPETKS